MLPAMAAKPTVAMVGAGRVGTALAVSLKRSGYAICEIVSRDSRDSQRRARKLAASAAAEVTTLSTAQLTSNLIWLCVPDRQIANCARALAARTVWNRKIVFHSSGALASDQLQVLRKRGAAVASVHPLMTFVSGTVPALDGVAFAIEGDPAALRLARRIVNDLHGESFPIRKSKKAAYHAWGGFTSPLLVAALVTGEEVARLAGLSAGQARKRMLPIVTQTLANYAALGSAGAFSGPIVRGDTEVVRQHLRVLRRVPEAREVYLALAKAALRLLPVRNKGELEKILR